MDYKTITAKIQSYQKEQDIARAEKEKERNIARAKKQYNNSCKKVFTAKTSATTSAYIYHSTDNKFYLIEQESSEDSPTPDLYGHSEKEITLEQAIEIGGENMKKFFLKLELENNGILLKQSTTDMAFSLKNKYYIIKDFHNEKEPPQIEEFTKDEMSKHLGYPVDDVQNCAELWVNGEYVEETENSIKTFGDKYISKDSNGTFVFITPEDAEMKKIALNIDTFIQNGVLLENTKLANNYYTTNPLDESQRWATLAYKFGDDYYTIKQLYCPYEVYNDSFFVVGYNYEVDPNRLPIVKKLTKDQMSRHLGYPVDDVEEATEIWQTGEYVENTKDLIKTHSNKYAGWDPTDRYIHILMTPEQVKEKQYETRNNSIVQKLPITIATLRHAVQNFFDRNTTR